MANESRHVPGGCWRCLPQYSIKDWTLGKLLHRVIVSLAFSSFVSVRRLIGGSHLSRPRSYEEARKLNLQ